MELRDLYDENRNLTGEVIKKGDLIPENRYKLVVVVFIQTSDGLFLIQKRSPEKGGEWAFTGGHPKSGETSLEGIKTETLEELGIEIDNPILIKEVKAKNTFCDLYYVKQDVDIKSIILQEEEVSDVAFKTREEIDKMYNDGIFKKGHYMMFQDCLEYLENNM